MSVLDAAAKVLQEQGQPMSCREMIQVMADKGYWTSPVGKTPARTLFSAILRELSHKKSAARFRKTHRGKFALNAQVRHQRDRGAKKAVILAIYP